MLWRQWLSISTHESAIENRRSKLMSMFLNMGIDAAMITSATNRLYYSGFTGSNGILIISVHGSVLITDSRYTEQAKSECAGIKIVQQKRGQSQVPDLVKSLEIEKLGIESGDITYAQYSQINEEMGTSGQLIALTDEIDVLRSVKDSEEIKLMEEAINLADIGMGKALDFIECGLTEKEVAWALEREMREFGADGVAFDSIVATGLNAAQPHHRAGNTKIKKGDYVVVDIGANYGGYRSDISRTVYVGGKSSTEFIDRYEAVLNAQLAAIGSAKCGMTGGDLDNIARNLIDSSEFKGLFSHGLGHGVGLNIHEKPMIVPGSKDVLSENMIFTIEPGIYSSNWGGIRLEDVIILEKEGARVLTKTPK